MSPLDPDLQVAADRNREGKKLGFLSCTLGADQGLGRSLAGRKRRELHEFDFDMIAVVPPFIYLGLSLVVLFLGLGVGPDGQP